jgi:hypothetical protein
MAQQSYIAVDLDGTLAEYTEWAGVLNIGNPIPKMVERIKAHIADGSVVKIFTARASEWNADNLNQVVTAIQNWTEEHIGVRLAVTNEKDYNMLFCYDDRAKQVVPNTGVLVEELLASLIEENTRLHDEINGLNWMNRPIG